jgi:hypothetical protein
MVFNVFSNGIRINYTWNTMRILVIFCNRAIEGLLLLHKKAGFAAGPSISEIFSY